MKVTGTTLLLDKKGLQAVGNGLKQGAKDVVKSYTGGNNKTENFGSKVGGLIGGGAQGAKKGKQEVNQKASQMSRLEGNQYTKSASAKSTVAKSTVKTAAKGLGVVGFVPDAITFGKGFVKGVKNTYSQSGR